MHVAVLPKYMSYPCLTSPTSRRFVQNMSREQTEILRASNCSDFGELMGWLDWNVEMELLDHRLDNRTGPETNQVLHRPSSLRT